MHHIVASIAYTGLRAQLLLYLDESRLELLDASILDLALLAQTIDDLIQALDVLLVLNLLLTYHAQLLHRGRCARLARAEVSHD